MKNSELSINEVKAMYFADDALLVSPYRLYRYQYRGDRFYYYQEPILKPSEEDRKLVEDLSPVKFAIGVTTLTSRTIPKPEALERWIADQGYEEAILYRDQRAKYGSFMHTCIAQLLIDRRFDLDALPEAVHNYCQKNHLTVNEDQWAEDLKKDLLAMAAFIREYDVKPLAIEYSLVCPRLGLAGTLDLLCVMNYDEAGYFGEVYASGPQKGQPKLSKRTVRVLAIVDFKSGRGATDSKHNAAQLGALRVMFTELFPELLGGPYTLKLYNWHPKDWRVSPSYTLKDQSEKEWDSAAIENLMALYRVIEPDPTERTITKLDGVIDLEAENDAGNISVKSITELVQEAVDENDAPPYEFDTIDNYITYKLNDYADATTEQD